MKRRPVVMPMLAMIMVIVAVWLTPDVVTRQLFQEVLLRVGTATSPVAIASDTSGVLLIRNDHPERWSAGIDNIGATLTEIKAAPAAGLSLYITGWIAQSTTTTAGQHTLRFGTGTNCGTGTGNLLNGAATARYTSPANTAAPTVVQLIPPLKVTAANAVCLLGVATNTTSMTLMGFTAP